ncbi:MAG: helix-turn-helix domain-containing protein [Bdellovibrionales bacterium]|nr:helix-turn-helix domain-containing protein [Bdellovibrionales bacterium]
MNSKKPAAARFRNLRSLLELSQRGLAREFGVSAAAVAHWESGSRQASGPALKLLEIFEKQYARSLYKRDELRAE